MLPAGADNSRGQGVLRPSLACVSAAGAIAPTAARATAARSAAAAYAARAAAGRIRAAGAAGRRSGYRAARVRAGAATGAARRACRRAANGAAALAAGIAAALLNKVREAQAAKAAVTGSTHHPDLHKNTPGSCLPGVFYAACAALVSAFVGFRLNMRDWLIGQRLGPLLRRWRVLHKHHLSRSVCRPPR